MDELLSMNNLKTSEVGRTYEMALSEWEGHLPPGFHVGLGSCIVEDTRDQQYPARGRIWTIIERDEDGGVVLVECTEWTVRA